MRRARRHSILTATSELSASTYSCGGEAGRFGGGDCCLKYFVIGAVLSTTMAMDSSSLDGADDREDESDNDMVERLVVFRGYLSWPAVVAR